MIKEILFIVVIVAFLCWIAYEKYFKKEGIQEPSKDEKQGIIDIN